MTTENGNDNPMAHPEEQGGGDDGSPKFGRLLLVLVAAVMLVGAVTFASLAIYS